LDYPIQKAFEWDETKNAACLRMRGFDFDFASRAFSDPEHLVIPDDRQTYGEQRFLLFGYINRRLYVVVFTRRAHVIRIISARKANPREIRVHANRPKDHRHQ
jgi:uncharacterized DUF497 family protein